MCVHTVFTRVFLCVCHKQSETIGYDPHASQEETRAREEAQRAAGSRASGPAAPDAMAQLRSMLATLHGEGGEQEKPRGTCTKCGGVGHLAFQCYNTISLPPRRSTPTAPAPARSTAVAPAVTTEVVTTTSRGRSKHSHRRHHRRHHHHHHHKKRSSSDSSDSSSESSSPSSSSSSSSSRSRSPKNKKHSHHKHRHHNS